MSMKFVKMHGCGNDYVYLDAITDPEIARSIDRPGWTRLVRRMSDRHRGIGSDGVIVVCPPTVSARRKGARVRMRMFNADGSESEMCGNGVRCVARFAHDHLGVRADPMLIQTGRGVLAIGYRTRRGRLVEATVDMGRPILDPARMGVRRSLLAMRGAGPHWAVGLPTGEYFWGVFVSMGNPHLVIFEPWNGGPRDLTPSQVRRADLERFGPLLERHAAFTARMNVHIAAVESRRRIVMRTWERGAGLTQACGTGACAAVVAAALTERSARAVDVALPGGTLRVEWEARSGRVFMTGEAVEVFRGTWSPG